MRARICAIIPTYNRASMLRECIDSVLAQTRPPDEIIIVNDGSTDNTEQVVGSYGNLVKLLTKVNGGKSSALNLGLENCEADYIWICDDDDIAAPDGLEQLTRVLDSDQDIDFVVGTYCMFYGEFLKRVYVDPPVKVRPSETNIKILFLEDMFTCQFAMLVRRSLYQTVGPFHEDMIRSQDHDMAIRLSRNAKGAMIPNIIFFQRQHDGQRGSLKESFKSREKEQKWLFYGQKVFEHIRRDFLLDEFTPSFAQSWDSQFAKRAALIERGCIFVRRALWKYAIEDFQQASTLAARPLTKEETEILETITNFEPAWFLLLDDSRSIGDLHIIYSSHGLGRSIIFSICRPLTWYIKQKFKTGQILAGLRILMLMVQLLGLRGAITRFAIRFAARNA